MTIYADRRLRPADADGPQPGDVPPAAAKPKAPLWARLCLVFGVLIMLASTGIVVVPRVLANWASAEIPIENLIPQELRGDNIDGAINLLLLGMDERKNGTSLIRADTIIIVHIPASHDQVFMISLPRDLEVAIPDFPPTGFTGFRTKINAAFAFGARTPDGKVDSSTRGRELGASLTMQTINNLVPGGLQFNGAAIINFTGFKKILEAIDGVHMCVDEETRSIHYDKTGTYHTMIYNDAERKVYKKGCRDFEAWEALDFARQRYGFSNGDYGRQRHQQQLLMAIFRKLMSKGTLTDLGKVSALQKAAGGLLTLDLSDTAIIDWIWTLKGIKPDSVVMIKTNGGKVNSTAGGNEALTDTSMALLEAVHDDTIYDFLTAHPDFIAFEK